MEERKNGSYVKINVALIAVLVGLLLNLAAGVFYFGIITNKVDNNARNVDRNTALIMQYMSTQSQMQIDFNRQYAELNVRLTKIETILNTQGK